MIEFYESGKVLSGSLVQDTTITTHGIPYTFSMIEFYESGKVKEGYLSKETTTITIGDSPYIFAARRDIEFYESGKVKGGELANPLTISIGGNKYQFDKVYFDSEGTIIQLLHSRTEKKKIARTLARPILLKEKLLFASCKRRDFILHLQYKHPLLEERVKIRFIGE